MKFQYKNALCCALAFLPMFMVGESQAGFAEEYDKAVLEKKHKAESYKNTQRLNDKQKLFLREVMGNRVGRIQVELCYMENGNLKQCKDGNHGMSWRLPVNVNNTLKYISNVTVSVEGDDSIITITASSAEFCENVTLIYDCSGSQDSGRLDCPISSKSSCLEKGLCSAGVFDVSQEDANRLDEVEFKVK